MRGAAFCHSKTSKVPVNKSPVIKRPIKRAKQGKVKNDVLRSTHPVKQSTTKSFKLPKYVTPKTNR